MRKKIVDELYKINENSRSYYLDVKVKQLFQRCLRLYFFYQKKDAYETLMLHDYGFYKFEQFQNFLSHKHLNQPYLQPIFNERTQFINYDESH